MSHPNIDPNGTYALVVGVEQYTYHRGIGGPAREAIKFATWLRNQGIPSSNIFLFISFLDQNEASNQHMEININLPTEENIRNLLDNNLLRPGIHGQLLYVFWSGHGFITRKGRNHFARHLYYQNSDAGNFYNLNLESLEEALRISPDGTGFQYQFFIIDACANILEDDEQISSYESSETPCRAMGGNNLNDQEIFYGASEMGVSTGKLANSILNILSTEPTLFLNAFNIYSILRPLISELTYRRIYSAYYKFEDDGYLDLPRTVLANRNEIIGYFREVMRGLPRRKRGIIINAISGLERNSLLQRVQEETDHSIVIDLRSAMLGVCYVFDKLSTNLGTENFPTLCNKLREYLREDPDVEDIPDSELLEEELINEALRVEPEQRTRRLSRITNLFFSDLDSLDLSSTTIIIDGYDRPNRSNLTTELLQWIEIKFLEGVFNLESMNRPILFILGDTQIDNYADISSYCKFYELVNTSIEFGAWKSYCLRKGYQLSDNEIMKAINIAMNSSRFTTSKTDFIYQILEGMNNTN